MTKIVKGCADAVIRLDDHAVAALDHYLSKHENPTIAQQIAAVKDVLSDIKAERRSILAAVKKAHPQAIDTKKPDVVEPAATENPQHIEAGKVEEVTGEVIRESITKSADKTPFNLKEATAWITKAVDDAVAKAGTEITPEVDDLIGRAQSLRSSIISLKKRLNPTDSALKTLAADKEALDRVIKQLDDQNAYVVFDVPGDGKFKVLNTKEKLTKFKANVLKAMAYKGTTSPLRETASQNSPTVTLKDMIGEDDMQGAYHFAMLHGGVKFGLGKDAQIAYGMVEDVSVEGIDAFVGMSFEQGRGKKDSKKVWMVIEPVTGQAIGDGAETKSKAIELAKSRIKSGESKGVKAKIADLIKEAEAKNISSQADRLQAWAKKENVDLGEENQEQPSASPVAESRANAPEALADEVAPAQDGAGPDTQQDKNSFSVDRFDREKDELSKESFERGEYVRVSSISAGAKGKSSFGEIEGISHTKKEVKIGGVWHPFGAIYKAERPAKQEEKKVPLSDVIDSANKKNGEGLTDADAVPSGSILDSTEAVMNAVRKGEATPEAYKAAFARLVEGKDSVLVELDKLSKDKLLAAGGGHFSYRYKSEKKAKVVSALYSAMLREFSLNKEYGPTGFMMGGHNDYDIKKQQALVDLVNAQTADDLSAYADEQKKMMDEIAGRVAANKEAIADPKTLEQFRGFLRHHISEGKTEKEARFLLTPAQRQDYDAFAAEESRSKRTSSREAQRSQVTVAAQTTSGQIIETKHTKTGEDLFVVKTADRVEREIYNQWNATAKKLGGYYSSFRGNGAVPGFQFRNREAADAFLKYIGGDAETAQEAVQARRDAFADDRSQSAAERLNEMAERLEERAMESLNADRKANTARRARFAASAEAAANSELALAKTMRNISTAIDSGSAKLLDLVRQKTQVEALSAIVRTAKSDELREKYPNYADQVKHQGERPTIETADHANWPTYTAYRSDLASLARQLLEVDGTKKIGQRLMAVADDVSDAYVKFAKENLHKVSTFRTQNSAKATFSSKADAEKAIARSGFRGKAIVLAFKRGENIIIQSPSEAMNNGIWNGDGDKRITLSPDFGAEIVEKIGKAARRGSKVSVPWQLETSYDRRKMLAKMGIETPSEYRTALREFIDLLDQPEAPSKVKELERAMVGRKNDGLDFFPTPATVSDDMVDAADIQEGMRVLEPSAGMGHIAERIREAGVEPDVVEMSADRKDLLEAKGFNVIGRDFMEIKQGDDGYDRIIMNPPFSDRRDAEHVQHAFDLLRPGGRIVAIMGEGVFFGSDKKAWAFRDWLDSVDGTSEKLPEGTFLDPSLPVNTGVNARMVVIDKPGGEIMHRRNQSEAAGITRQEAEKVVADFVGQYKGAQKLGFDIFDTKEQAYGTDNLKRMNLEDQVLKGGYKDGKVHVILDGHKDASDLLDTLRHETWTHYGFDLVQPLRKAKILNDLKADIDANGALRSIFDQVSRQYRDDNGKLPSKQILVEETVARIAEIYGDRIHDRAMESGLKSAVRKILDYVAAVLRSIGLMQKEGGIEQALKFLVQSARTQRSNVYTQFSAATGMQLASQKGDGNWYYSALKEAAADMVQNKGTPEQMLAMLARQKGVKPAEIEATGLKEYLELQGKSVTKQQIVDYLAGNGVQVQETILGAGNEPKLPDGWEVNYDQEQGAWVVTDQDGEEIADGTTRADAIEMAMDDEERADNPDSAGGTKFGQYVLPGGTNYRELLLTLPKMREVAKRPDSPALIAAKAEVDRLGVDFREHDSQSPAQRAAGIAYMMALSDNNQPQRFTSSHYDQDNILAHVRFNERTDADGKRVLFLEELQSDWAQEGRKEGFGSTTVWVVSDRGGFDYATAETEAEAQKIIDEDDKEGKLRLTLRKDTQWPSVPSAPFVTSTDAWVGLALKRMISYAAENGFDRIAWTTGEQQADRYALSRSIKEVYWDFDKHEGGKKVRLYFDKPNGSSFLDLVVDDNGVVTKREKSRKLLDDGLGATEAVVGKGLDDVIGKDLAARIMEEAKGSLVGEKMDFGGKGMKSFYDNIVPKVAKEITKKVGGRVESIALGDDIEDQYRKLLGRDGFHADEIDGMVKRRSKAEMKSTLDDAERSYVDGTDQPGFDITPEMRGAVESGLPLFRRSPMDSFSEAARNIDVKQELKDGIQGKLTDLKPMLLGAIPLNYLRDFARNGMSAVGDYIDIKRKMDKERDVLQNLYDKRAQDWWKWTVSNKVESQATADLMHDSTIAGQDPSVPFVRLGNETDDARHAEYGRLKARFDKLSTKAQELYQNVRDDYKSQRELLDETITGNITKAAHYAELRAEREYNDELDKIAEDDLTDEQEADALNAAKLKRDRSIKAAQQGSFGRIAMLRKVFESNAVPAPYFPLFRDGDYFAAVFNGRKIQEVRHFTKAADQIAFVREQKAKGMLVRYGRKSNAKDIAGAIDPRFIADIDHILAELPDADQIRDQIYQQYLESMPDMSIRKSFIHRKKTPGFSNDALKAYASRMFHGSYQIARLKYGMDLQDSVERAEEQAKKSPDPVNGQALANELALRHQWVMNPSNSKASQWATTAAFVYYLGASPAQLLLNGSQTIMMGIPILGSRYGNIKATGALLNAGKEFFSTRGPILDSLEGNEKKAMQEFYDSGLVDRGQTHDLAGIGDNGSGYSAGRTYVMGKIGWFFQKAEVFNREVTALAAYRLGVEAGLSHEMAIKDAAERTWQAHFDYTSGNRARYMQNDWAKTFLVFRQYSINMLYRLFRDINDSMKGETPQIRKEARKQLGSLMGMYALLAGVSGMPFYGIAMMIGKMFDDDDEDFEQDFKQGTYEMFGDTLGHMITGGVPGTLTNTDLTTRIGMGNLWFRDSDPQLEGKDAYWAFMQQLLGAVPAMGANVVTGVGMALNGHVERGIEAMMPTAIRGLMRGARYGLTDEAATMGGDKLADVSNWSAIAQAMGFTPAHIAEQYEENAALRNMDANIKESRREILNGYAVAMKTGDGKEDAIKAVQEFNKRYPFVAITSKSIHASLKSRAKREALTENGVYMNRSLRALQEKRAAEE